MRLLFISCVIFISTAFISADDNPKTATNPTATTELKPQWSNRGRSQSTTILCHYENQFIWFEFDEEISEFETIIYDSEYNVIITDFVYDDSFIEIPITTNTLHIKCITEEDLYEGTIIL